jgi:hypothetical protein
MFFPKAGNGWHRIGRNFKQPKEGLGFDTSPSAHMWRTLNWPTRFL